MILVFWSFARYYQSYIYKIIIEGVKDAVPFVLTVVAGWLITIYFPLADYHKGPNRLPNSYRFPIVLVLVILWGMIGAHRFYLRKPFTGLLWMSTFGLGGLGWIIDIVRIASGSLKDGYGQPILPGQDSRIGPPPIPVGA